MTASYTPQHLGLETKIDAFIKVGKHSFGGKVFFQHEPMHSYSQFCRMDCAGPHVWTFSSWLKGSISAAVLNDGPGTAAEPWQTDGLQLCKGMRCKSARAMLFEAGNKNITAWLHHAAWFAAA